MGSRKGYGDDATGNAARDGYTCIARRPRSLKGGEIKDLETADRIDEMAEEYGMMARPIGGYGSDYD